MGRASLAAAVAALLFGAAVPARAQGVELTPFIGVRGGDEPFFNPYGRAADVDHDPAVGFALNVPLWEGLQVEGFVTHQQVRMLVFPDALGPGALLHGAVDHYQAGALQEFGRGHARPFLTGLLGVSRYAVEGDNEVRFAVTAGGGVKLFPVSHVGVRIDGRIYSTFLDASTTSGVCGGSGCLLGLHIDVAWQFEFTAGVVLKFGPGT